MRSVSQSNSVVSKISPSAQKVIAVPRFFVDDFSDYWGFLAYMGSTQGERMFGKGFDASRLEPLTHELARRGRASLAKAPVYLPRLAASSIVSRVAFRRGPDVVLTPVLSGTTPQLEH